MYEDIPLDSLLPNPKNANRISRTLGKKLRHNIEQIGMYETLTVRPHPGKKRIFQVLNGHARLQVLRELGTPTAKCDVWEVTDSQATLFLAILNKLRGSDVPELRMSLLLELLQVYPREQLSEHIPETLTHLAKLERLSEEVQVKTPQPPAQTPDVIILEFYLVPDQHHLVSAALTAIKKRFNLADSGQALAKMAELYLAQSRLQR
jgi:ParB-like chromosome segregation protein Spo0J